MEVLYKRLPKDIINIIEEYSKDNTNYEKVILQFESFIRQLIEVKLEEEDSDNDQKNSNIDKIYNDDNYEYQDNGLSWRLLKKFNPDAYEKRMDSLNEILQIGQLRTFCEKNPTTLLYFKFPTPSLQFYSKPRKCIMWHNFDKYLRKKAFWTGLPKNRLTDQLRFELERRFLEAACTGIFYFSPYEKLMPYIFDKFAFQNYHRWLKCLLSMKSIDPYYYEIDSDDENYI